MRSMTGSRWMGITASTDLGSPTTTACTSNWRALVHSGPAQALRKAGPVPLDRIKVLSNGFRRSLPPRVTQPVL